MSEPFAPKEPERPETETPAAGPADATTPAAATDAAANGTTAHGGPTTLPTSVMVLGFVAIVLTGVLVAVTLRGAKTAKGGAGAQEDPGLREQNAKLQLLQESLNQERAKLGLTPMYGQTTESVEAVATRLTEDAATLVDMAKGVKDLIATKDAKLDERTKEWSEAVKLQGVLREQVAKLQADLNRALIEGSDATTLRSQLETANQRVLSLNEELRRLREGSADLAGLAAERDNLRARVTELENRLAQASLFAGTEAELFQEAVELVRSLRILEDRPASELDTAYSQFNVQLGADLLDKIDFPTGVAEVAPEQNEKLATLPLEAPENAVLLVVGYASETGNVDDNRALSSARATAVARALNEVKKPGQRVQAVYLGQTDRFGSKFPERNQISEIWQVVPRGE